MRAVVQRVTRASVTVGDAVVGSIGPGLLVLVGVTHSDGREDAHALAGKVAKLRVFGDEAGKMNLAVGDVGGAVLVVSQFTLFGSARRGNRPSFTEAAEPGVAERLIGDFAAQLRSEGVQVASGLFGAAMAVELVNDGPVTLILESRDGRVT